MSGNRILVYDWSGRPICLLIIEYNRTNICVDNNNNKRIGLSCDNDYLLYEFNLPKFYSNKLLHISYSIKNNSSYF